MPSGQNNPNFRHGKKNTRLYNVWQGMKQRCYNPNSIKYKNYGARGITVCDEWKNNFINFYNWAIQNGYDETKTRKEQSLDRINNNKNYEPSNCRWVSQKVNCRNRNNNVIIEYNGETKTVAEWSSIFQIKQSTLLARLKKYKNLKDVFSKDNLLKMKHKSNTGEFGISQNKNSKKFVLSLNQRYIGQFNTLEEAIEKREVILNGNK